MTTEYTVISDGTAKGTHVYADGSPLSGIRSLTVEIDAMDKATLTLEVNIGLLTLVTDDEPMFIGLEDVSDEALRQEIERRG